MKKLFFSFVMMLALVIVTGSAMAQTNTTPYKGGTYGYTLSAITVVGPSTATISYSGTGGTPSITTKALATTDHSLTFNVAYDLLTAASGTLKVVIKDDATGCSNQITWAITVANAPTLDLAVTSGNAAICQVATGTTNNVAASSGQTTTYTYTITPSVVASGSTTYDYNFAVTPSTSTLTGFTVTRTTGDGTISGTYATGFVVTGANSPTQVFTVSFTTTTGIAAAAYTGTISSPKLHVTAGGGVYNGSLSTPSYQVTVNTIPTIGTFN